MVYAIIIGTTANGSKRAVCEPLPLPVAKEKFKTLESGAFKMIELFDLRQNIKRRKLSAVQPKPVLPVQAEPKPVPPEKAPLKKSNKKASKKAAKTKPRAESSHSVLS